MISVFKIDTRCLRYQDLHQAAFAISESSLRLLLFAAALLELQCRAEAL